MKRAHFTLGAVMILAFAANGASAESWKRIKTKEAFVAAMEGKVFEWGGTGTARLSSDGTTSGKLPDASAYSGNCVWNYQRYCRNIKLANGSETGTDCARVDAAGNKIRIKFKSRESILTAK